jgi:hypothetical protein
MPNARLMAACFAVVATGSARAQNAPRLSQDGRCEIREERREILGVGGAPLYVEPSAFVQAGTRTLLIGTPTYWWVSSPGTPQRVERDSLIGVVIDAKQRVVPVIGPIPGRLVRAVRAVALDGTSWGVTFAEVAAETAHNADSVVARNMWFGIYDGVSWRDVEQLPMPPHGRLRIGLASALLHTSRSLSIAIPVDSAPLKSSVVVFTRDQGGWHSVEVEMRAASYAALAVDSSGNALLAVVSADDRLAFDENSLFIYVRSGDGAWRSIGRVLSGVGQPMHWPQLTANRDRLQLSWTAMVQTPSGVRPEARSVPVSWLGQLGKVSLLDSMVALVVPFQAPSQRTGWVLVHVVPSGSRLLRMLFAQESGATALGSIDNPFDGPFGAAMSGPTTVLLAGPRGGATAADPAVVTLLLHLRVRCQEGAP